MDDFFNIGDLVETIDDSIGYGIIVCKQKYLFDNSYTYHVFFSDGVIRDNWEEWEIFKIKCK